eukprot:4915142-Pleurochrysis_carterae.AAC.1
MEEVRTLLDQWDKPFNDLPLTKRRRLHDQACKRRGLLHQALSDKSFRPGADRVADTYVEVALHWMLSTSEDYTEGVVALYHSSPRAELCC